MDEKIKTIKRLGLMVRSYRQRLESAQNRLDGALIELENCRRQLGDTRQELQIAEEKLEVLRKLLNGEWVATQDVEEALGITFREGLKRFDFSRTASWNPWPLNGQRIDTFFRLKELA